MTQPSLKDIVLRDGSWTFALKIASMGASLAVSIVLARLLDPELLGTYFLILSFVSFAALVAQLGLNLAVVRLLAESLALGQTSGRPAPIFVQQIAVPLVAFHLGDLEARWAANRKTLSSKVCFPPN